MPPVAAIVAIPAPMVPIELVIVSAAPTKASPRALLTLPATLFAASMKPESFDLLPSMPLSKPEPS